MSGFSSSIIRAAFSAHKNGVDQTGVVSDTSTKVTFGATTFNVGGFFNTSNSRFTPPAGYYRLSGSAHVLAPQDGYRISMQIIKNGALYRANYNSLSGTLNQNGMITAVVEANGSDYFEFFASIGGTTNKTIYGGAPYTFCDGHAVV